MSSCLRGSRPSIAGITNPKTSKNGLLNFNITTISMNDLNLSITVPLLLSELRTKLLDTTARNRLVHLNRHGRMAMVNIVNEKTNEIYDLMRTKGRKMNFMPLLAEDDVDEAGDGEEDPYAYLFSSMGGHGQPFDTSRYTDQNLEVRAKPSALEKRLTTLQRKARLSREEKGMNTLFLAMGFLNWRELQGSQTRRCAPLLLLPVELKKDGRGGKFTLRASEEEMVTNHSLAARLAKDFDLNLPEVEEGEDWDVSSYLKQAETLVEGRAGWSVDRDAMTLAEFQFARLIMMKDLEPENWPGQSIADHKLVESLLSTKGFEEHSGKPGKAFPNDHRGDAWPQETKGSKLDQFLDPANLFHVVDADASQAQVIEEVRSGKSLLVQGPPGTGKSQTIANILASAVRDGKRVMFLAEKMAALNVVAKRMERVGLGPLCLKLHSPDTNKRDVAHFLGATMQAAALSDPVRNSSSSKTKHLNSVRDALNRASDTLNTAISYDQPTPHQIIGTLVKYSERNAPTPLFTIEGLADTSLSTEKESLGLINAYVEALDERGRAAWTIFCDTGNLTLQPTDLKRFQDAVSNAKALIADKKQAFQESEAVFGPLVSSPINKLREIALIAEFLNNVPLEPFLKWRSLVLEQRDKPQFIAAIETLKAWQAAKAEFAPMVDELALDAAWMPQRDAILAAQDSFIKRYFGPYRSAKRTLASYLTGDLPKTAKQQLTLVNQILAAQRTRREFDKIGAPILGPLMGEAWLGEKTDVQPLLDALKLTQKITNSIQNVDLLNALGDSTDHAVKALAGNAGNFRAHLSDATASVETAFAALDSNQSEKLTDGEHSFEDLEIALTQKSEQIELYQPYVQVQRALGALSGAGLKDLVELVRSGKRQLDRLADEYSFALAEARWKKVLATSPGLADFAQVDRSSLVTEFQKMDKARIQHVAEEILNKHFAKFPQPGEKVSRSIASVKNEAGKKIRHRPIRKLMTDAGGAVQFICPIFLMSPLSVAKYLPPNAVNFDMVVIDEASQVRPEDALGAIARTAQLVVVGDRQQMPPTNMFGGSEDVGGEDDNIELPENMPAVEDRADRMESILTLCEARGLPSHMLKWHYRSQDPSLISPSNREFYNGQLILPPSPYENDPSYGLNFVPVLGEYSSQSKGSGRSNTNFIEATAIIRALKQQAADSSTLSVGIVTLSKPQADLIEDLLNNERLRDPELDSYCRRDDSEGVFIKNLENVQGDERDIILISVCFGPYVAGGKLAHQNFGPVNRPGGERRLNVLFTRARIRTSVFCSFEPTDIRVGESTPKGVQVMRMFLDYAQDGKVLDAAETGLGFDNPFEEEVARYIKSCGYEATPQVGSAGFRIDLAVTHPEITHQYMLAVECDGATYHSSAWARSRDRQRQSVLEHLGWKFHRVWSTDWFYRPDQTKQLLRAALEEASRSVMFEAKLPDPVEDQSAAQIDLANNTLPIVTPNRDEPSQLLEAEIEEMLPDGLSWVSLATYKTCKLHKEPVENVHEVELSTLNALARQVVSIEGPVHTREIARRIANAYGKSRVGDHILTAVKDALLLTKSDQNFRQEGEFWLLASQMDAPPMRRRDMAEPALKSAEMISPREIRAISSAVRKEAGEIHPQELVVEVIRALGFKRAGNDLRTAVHRALFGNP